MALGEGMTRGILEEIRASPNISGVALLRNGEIQFSTLPGPKISLIKLIARRLERTGQPGDYVVKRSSSSSLITVKGYGSYILSVEGRGPEGVLISTATRLVSALVEDVGRDLSKPSGPYPGSPPISMSLSLEAIPILKRGFSAEIAVDVNVLKVLRHIDGLNNLRAIVRKSGIAREDALNIVANLIYAGIIHIRTRGEEIEDKALMKLAKVAYELDERFSRPEEALRILGDSDEVLRLLVANLHRGLTASEYKRLADEAGLDISLPSVIRALESLRSMGIAKRKGEKPPPRHVKKDIPHTAISVLLTTMH